MPFLQGKIWKVGEGVSPTPTGPSHTIPVEGRGHLTELALSSHHGVLGIKLRWLTLAASVFKPFFNVTGACY